MCVKRVGNILQKGFTLIELTIGIAVLSIALLVMTGALFPQAEKSTDPWFQVRSAELAHSLMNEILARKFDENSLVVGDLRCGETEGATSAPACISVVDLNDCDPVTGFRFREEADRADFDDVDDFNCYEVSGDLITDITNSALTDVYKAFTVRVDVAYSGAAKQITVTVTPPRGLPVVYSTFKANY